MSVRAGPIQRTSNPCAPRGCARPRLAARPLHLDSGEVRSRLPTTAVTMRIAIRSRSPTMKITRTMLMLATLSVVCVSLALAQPATPRVDRREARQHARIQQGVRSRELTPGEAVKLRAGQAHVRGMERRAKADGVVTPRERVRLNHAQNRQSRRIARLKHNDRVR